jgi:nicotinate-nucleotide pyrophosphorylase (carboxylating)
MVKSHRSFFAVHNFPAPELASRVFCLDLAMSQSEEQLHRLIVNALEEDIGAGDHTTLCCVPPDLQGRAELKIKQDGVLAGMQVAEKIFHSCAPAAQFTPFKKDGDCISYGDRAFELEAPAAVILQCERLVLNCMQRMSGIATLTRQYTEKISGHRTRILDSRKTTPNFRLLEKEAVRIGGGWNHRFGLFDMILLKDNHIDYCGGITRAIERAGRYVQQYAPGVKIEIETRSLDEVREVLSAGMVDRIMLDNFSPDTIREALRLIDGRFETEASGGINLENLKEFADTGVDFISIGSLIHQARSLDMSLKAVF